MTDEFHKKMGNWFRDYHNLNRILQSVTNRLKLLDIIMNHPAPLLKVNSTSDTIRIRKIPHKIIQ